MHDRCNIILTFARPTIMSASPARSSTSFPPCPDAPRKKPRLTLDFSHLNRIPKLELPPTPPSPPPRKRPELTTKERIFTPISINWGVIDFDGEARRLATTGRVREKYLHFTPSDIMKEGDALLLEFLDERYHPYSQPRTLEETAYMSIMHTAIVLRLDELS